jgi:phosphatidylserine/phosphatidylglycerophosphate/cardiolipin synthase-like enzyme
MADPNVVDVRPGYKFQAGWITDTPAVVVTVLQKGDPQALGSQPIPTELDGVPTDVAAATPAEQLRHLAGGAEATRGAASALPPPEDLLAPGETPAVAAADRGARGADNHQYQPPPDLKLTAVGGPITLLCHASPDAGWPTLEKFFAGIRKTLTVAMYDFGAKHIVQAIEAAMDKTKGDFVLNLDRKSNPKRDGEFTEEQVVQQFKKALKDRFVSSTAAVGILYPNAYHIKVAVRDGKAFWISSGNWQGSNQPDVDAFELDDKALRELFSKHNREWHVVCDHPKLAETFEGYIKFDVAEATRVGERGMVPPPLPELLMPAVAEPEDVRAPLRPVKRFKPKKFTFAAADKVKVQPILTPDNYGEHVVPLILSAKKTLYFQNQYIKIPKVFPDGDGKPALKELAEALRDRVAAGVDVRIILRNGGDTRPMLQALKVFGIPADRVKLLGGCHNKGIVADKKAVLVSSQNYSADGVRFNRDAGLLIRHPDVAAYYAQIFEHDWDNRATQRVVGERGDMPLVPQAAARGGVRAAVTPISWEDFYGD